MLCGGCCGCSFRFGSSCGPFYYMYLFVCLFVCLLGRRACSCVCVGRFFGFILLWNNSNNSLLAVIVTRNDYRCVCVRFVLVVMLLL